MDRLAETSRFPWFRIHPMSRLMLPALVGAILFVAAPAVRADPFTDHLDALQLELAQRLAEDFGGDLDKATKKQLKAVQQSLAFLAKPADSASDDLKALTKCAKKLGKAYAGEFEPGQPADSFGPLVNQAVSDLRVDADERRQELGLALPTLSPASVVKKVTKLHDKAAESLTDALGEGELFALVKLVTKATKFLDKADAKSAKADGMGVYLVIAVDGGTPIAADEPFAEWNANTGELQLFGQRVNEHGLVVTVVVVMDGIDGPGSYPFTGDGWSGYYETGGTFNSTRYDIVEGSGSLVVDELDIDGSVVRGTFAFSAHNDDNGTTFEFPHGAYRLTTIYQ